LTRTSKKHRKQFAKKMDILQTNRYPKPSLVCKTSGESGKEKGTPGRRSKDWVKSKETKKGTSRNGADYSGGGGQAWHFKPGARLNTKMRKTKGEKGQPRMIKVVACSQFRRSETLNSGIKKTIVGRGGRRGEAEKDFSTTVLE